MLTIGSDPEFVVYKDKRLVPAHNFVEGGIADEFGVDGDQDTGEVRPHYAKSPIKHFNNLSKIIFDNLKNYSDNLDFFACSSSRANEYCYERPSGGHIHLGGLQPSTFEQLANNLSNYLALPFMVIQTNEVRQRQRKTSYGKLDDWREQNGVMEYRQLPSFIGEPELAKSIYCVAFCIADATQRGILCSKKLPHELNQANFDEFFNFEAIKERLNKLRDMPLYKKYKKEVDYFIDRISTGKVYDPNIIKNWGIKLIETLRLNKKEYEKIKKQKINLIKSKNEKVFYFSEVAENDYNLKMITYSLNNILSRYENLKYKVKLFAINKDKGDYFFANRYQAVLGFDDKFFANCLTRSFDDIRFETSFRQNLDRRQYQADVIIGLPYKARQRPITLIRKLLKMYAYLINETSTTMNYFNCEKELNKKMVFLPKLYLKYKNADNCLVESENQEETCSYCERLMSECECETCDVCGRLVEDCECGDGI